MADPDLQYDADNRLYHTNHEGIVPDMYGLITTTNGDPRQEGGTRTCDGEWFVSGWMCSRIIPESEKDKYPEYFI